MGVIKFSKTCFDVELEGTVYRIYGCLTGVFCAFANEICRVEGKEKLKIDAAADQAFLDDRQRLWVARTVCSKWPSINFDYDLYFYDGHKELICRAEHGHRIEVCLLKAEWMLALIMALLLGVFGIYLSAVLREGEETGRILHLVFVMAAIPWLIAGLLGWRFRLTAAGERLTVRPAAGRKYSFSVSEITKIVRRTDAADIWNVQKITIDTESKRVSVNSFMAGIEELDAYLIKHVGSEKIIKKGFGK